MRGMQKEMISSTNYRGIRPHRNLCLETWGMKGKGIILKMIFTQSRRFDYLLYNNVHEIWNILNGMKRIWELSGNERNGEIYSRHD